MKNCLLVGCLRGGAVIARTVHQGLAMWPSEDVKRAVAAAAAVAGLALFDS